MLPDDIDTMIAKIKAKKGAPANEEPPADVEPDKVLPTPGDASPEPPADAAPGSADKPE
jgi:membrane protein required for colicin V production